MAKSYIQRGETITVTAPTGGVKSGDGIVVGNLFGICATDADQTKEVEITLVGVWELPKASGQILEGAKVWWSTTDGNVKNATGAGLWPVGVAIEGAASDATKVKIRL